ncbi:PRD domain-containing protein [Streptococcus constellatus]|uniref:PRD domain-containing protein n=1 Tax=Streptococcus anginosus group TaxID=671232 RepID=UPI001C5812D1|nr:MULTISPECIES: transcription antiterminator [Streptococcus anginosus group]MBW3452140.1 transcription antiterminator [Streptococcus constellatus]HEN7482997.1 transcription antiterminator [Streptococcus agalactiae]HEO2521437.1 transcription antiterminator [Streptococcus agalactiae]HEO8171128.1 transcription antiterminator [Streptococcus agalactiae]
MYRILNPMNHNVALVRNKKGEELVIVGKGIIFGKKKGDFIPKDKVEKVFRMKTEESRENFMTLLKDVPLDFITVTYEVIDSLSKKYGYPVQDYIYVTLTDHIYCSYQAVQQRRYKDSALPDASEIYPVPYKIAQEAVAIYRERLLDTFPDDEINRIAYHFINAEGDSNSEGQNHLDKRKEILGEVEAELMKNGIRRTTDNSNFYDRFMIHLNYFLDYLDRSRDDNVSLLEMESQIKQTYPEAYRIGSTIYEIVSQKTGVDLYQSERVYLVLHIQRLL